MLDSNDNHWQLKDNRPHPAPPSGSRILPSCIRQSKSGGGGGLQVSCFYKIKHKKQHRP
jgi:hypothetical protein